jgi:hypothetical protein
MTVWDITIENNASLKYLRKKWHTSQFGLVVIAAVAFGWGRQYKIMRASVKYLRKKWHTSQFGLVVIVAVALGWGRRAKIMRA